MKENHPPSEKVENGELVYVHGIHNPEPYSWGWAMVIERQCLNVESKLVKVWKVLFRGKLVLLESEEFTRFKFYNKHLFNENFKKMVS